MKANREENSVIFGDATCTNWKCPSELKGNGVTLRAIMAHDKLALLEAFSELDRAFTTFVPDRDTFDAWFALLETERKCGRSFAYTVLDSNEDICGTTRFLRMSAAHKRLEIGGTLYAPRVQRTHVNTEAKSLLLHHAFEEFGCNVVQLRTDWLNHRSRRAIERLGAKMDGLLRAHMVMAGGHVRDTVCYSILAREWPGVRAHLNSLRDRSSPNVPPTRTHQEPAHEKI